MGRGMGGTWDAARLPASGVGWMAVRLMLTLLAVACLSFVPILADDENTATNVLQVRALVARLVGDAPAGREGAIKELRTLGRAKLFPLLRNELGRLEPGSRCKLEELLPRITCPEWATTEPGTPCDEDSGVPRVVTDRTTGIGMVLIPPGTFMMGISPGDAEVDPNTDYEQPAREVRIAKAFYLGKYEVTNVQWRRVMKERPRRASGGDDHPVVDVSWKEIQAFLKETGLRLPADAEWEYSCRAGAKGPRYGTLDDIASWRSNTGGTTAPVGTKKPNAFCLYDMLGNVWEWCADSCGERETGDAERREYDAASKETLRTLRGGGSRDSRTYWLRASVSAYQIESYRNLDLGFRVARDP